MRQKGDMRLLRLLVLMHVRLSHVLVSTAVRTAEVVVPVRKGPLARPGTQASDTDP